MKTKIRRRKHAIHVITGEKQGRRSLCVVAFCLFFCFWGPNPTVAGASFDGFSFEVATDLLNRGLYLEAVGVYQDIVGLSENDENRAKALLFIGTTYSLYLEQLEGALKPFDIVLNTYPKSAAAPDALFNRGMVLYQLKRYEASAAAFTRYLAQYPEGKRRQSAAVWAENAWSRALEETPETSPPIALEAGDATMRILLEQNARRLTVSAPENLAVYDEARVDRPIVYGKGPCQIEMSGGRIAVNGRRVSCRSLRMVPDGTTLSLADRAYRGFLTLSIHHHRLQVVNHLPMAHYLYGVLPEEMPHTWPKEALKAQAVASRTYALYVRNKRRDQPYDLDATTAFQVYGGVNAEKKRTSQAVDETKNQVMTHDGKLVIAYFHANSGGHTEDSENVWGVELPYLIGIPDPYSTGIAEADWEYFAPYSEVCNRLNQYGFDMHRVERFQAADISPSGRMLKIHMVSDKGAFTLSSNDFRIKLGSRKLKSTFFKTTGGPNGVLFKGKGYGHGVGMSQWGARRMAESGLTYSDILRFYYRNVQIITAGLY